MVLLLLLSSVMAKKIFKKMPTRFWISGERARDRHHDQTNARRQTPRDKKRFVCCMTLEMSLYLVSLDTRWHCRFRWSQKQAKNPKNPNHLVGYFFLLPRPSVWNKARKDLSFWSRLAVTNLFKVYAWATISQTSLMFSWNSTTKS